MQKIFIIHGWTYTLDAWKGCEDEFRSRDIEPVMLRVPGLTSPSSEIWDLDKYVAWLENELRGEKDIVLAGHSNGGRIAIAYAGKNPAALKKLILIDSAGIFHDEASLEAKRKLLGRIARAGKAVADFPILRKIFYRLIGAKDYLNAPVNMRETMKNLLPVDLRPQLGTIAIPALIIWGEKDAATPVSDAHIMNAGIAGSEIFIIPDAGHSPHKTHPALVAEKIASFVR